MAQKRTIEVFGRYRLLHRFALGGTAEVFLAQIPEAPSKHQFVVVKRLRKELCEQQQYVEMFIDEKRVISTLGHDNIIRLYEFGHVDQRYFMTLEHVWGESVATLCNLCTQQKMRFPVGAALYIGIEVAKALQYAHEHSNNDGNLSPVIHRDVTLGNVVISYDGDVKVLDYGIAKAEGRLSHTLAGQIKGTLAYLSPEQLARAPVGPYTDIYQLGVFLYKTIVGCEPFQGKSDYEFMEAIAGGNMIAPSSVVASLPKRVERILCKAMARRPSQRFTSAGQLAKALQKLMGPAYEEGRQGLRRMIAKITGDRRQRQKKFIEDLVSGLRVDEKADELFHRSTPSEEPATLHVQLSSGIEEEPPSPDRDLTDVIEMPEDFMREDSRPNSVDDSFEHYIGDPEEVAFRLDSCGESCSFEERLDAMLHEVLANMEDAEASAEESEPLDAEQFACGCSPLIAPGTLGYGEVNGSGPKLPPPLPSSVTDPETYAAVLNELEAIERGDPWAQHNDSNCTDAGLDADTDFDIDVEFVDEAFEASQDEPVASVAPQRFAQENSSEFDCYSPR